MINIFIVLNQLDTTIETTGKSEWLTTFEPQKEATAGDAYPAGNTGREAGEETFIYRKLISIFNHV